METEILRQWREDFHRSPELALDLPLTQKKILEILGPLNCDVSVPVESSVAAFFDFGKKDSIMVRSDMDALPVTEQTGAAYASQIPGRMHACGHDAHMTMLLGLAADLSEREDLPWNVLLVFQPGEETPGGARLIVESGLLEEKNVRAAFGLHVWPQLPAGAAAVRKGPMMAASSEVDIDIEGKSAHAAKYRLGKDALEAGIRLVSRIYEEESGLDPSVYRLLRFGRMEGGTIRNVVAQSARIEGTVRAYEPDRFQGLKDMIRQCASETETGTGCRIRVRFSDGYPAVINDPDLTGKILDLMPEVTVLDEPEMISEDFSFYGQKVPSVFFFLGTGTGIPLHDPRFDLTPEVLEAGTRFWTTLIDRLSDKESGFSPENMVE